MPKPLTLNDLDVLERRVRSGEVLPREETLRLLSALRSVLDSSREAPRPERSEAAPPPASEAPMDEGGPTLVEVFTDGACKGNPGPGGWAAILRQGRQEKEFSGAESLTTNNRMELTAAIEALRRLHRSCRVRICTDSQYLKNGITLWIRTWKRNGWKTSARKPVKNVDLWQELDRLAARHQVEWCWVAGHAGHPENERCDRLAREALDRLS